MSNVPKTPNTPKGESAINIPEPSRFGPFMQPGAITSTWNGRIQDPQCSTHPDAPTSNHRAKSWLAGASVSVLSCFFSQLL